MSLGKQLGTVIERSVQQRTQFSEGGHKRKAEQIPLAPGEFVSDS